MSRTTGAVGEASGQQPAFGAGVPLERTIRLDRDRVHDALREVIGQTGARVRMLDAGPARGGILAGLRGQSADIKVEIAGVRVVLRASAKPLCSPSTMHSFINPSVWRGGLGGMTDHRAHLLIAEDETAHAGTSRDAMFDRATAVTLATAAMANLAEPLGVIWLPARNAVPMTTFGSEMERFIEGLAPLQFWVRWQMLAAPLQEEQEFGRLAGEALNPGVATLGLTAFIGAEIVAPPSVVERDVMLDHMLALASAVIDENAQLKDGAVYGKPGGAMVRLNLKSSGPYSNQPYWELLPRPAPARPAPPAEGGTGAGPRPGGTEGAHPRLRLIKRGR